MEISVAIDFGTSRSGYGYAFQDGKVCLENNWPGQPVEYAKTLSLLLCTQNGEALAYGYEARQKLAELRIHKRANQCHMFRHFKMSLRNGKPGPHGPMLSDNGRSFPVVELIAKYLRFLRDKALAKIQGGSTGLLNSEDIRWYLTVPAIWTDAQKQLMRLAALQAGIIGAGRADAERLTLVLEPEAAAIYCHKTDQSLNQSQLAAGTRFMIIDAGGGTVDLTVHEVDGEGQLRELVPGSGDACGSAYIDEQFKNYINKRLEGAMTEFHTAEPSDFTVFMDDWERCKCNYAGGDDISFLQMPNKLYRMLQLNSPGTLQRLANEQDGDNSQLLIPPQIMRTIFAPVLDKVSAVVADQFKRLGSQKCDYIFLVGGFAESPLLQQRIRKDFGSQVRKVIVPPRPSAAVLTGAVFFALDPSYIRSRTMRLTYGCQVDDVYDSALDRERTSVWKPEFNAHYCCNRFDAFVRAGQAVSFDDAIRRNYCAPTSTATQVTLSIVVTSKDTVRYTDEPGVSTLGVLTVLMPVTTGGVGRRIEVAMYFGRTELNVEAKDLTTGKLFGTTFKYS